MSYLKSNALRVLNELHSGNRIDCGAYLALFEGLNEIDTLRDRDETLEELWDQFSDIPMNPETECIEAPFLGWDVRVSREEIWHWFDQRHSKGVVYLLYGGSDRDTSESDPGMTIERAIELLETGTQMPTTPHTVDELDEACEMACNALRAQLAAYVQHERDDQPKIGDEVWIVERDEEGNVCEVTGYMLLAKSRDYVIVSGYINGIKHLNGIMAYHVRETAKNYGTDLAVFPAEDCYNTSEAAHAAKYEERGYEGE